MRNYHISTNCPKAELKDFTIIDRDSNTYTVEQKKHFTFVLKIYHSTESLAKFRILSVFNKLEQTHMSNPTTKGITFFVLSFQHTHTKKNN